jgi:hypothetical protein
MNDLLAGYKHANDLCIQLISLATLILGLSITFMRDVLKQSSPTWALKVSWICLLTSVIFGIWMMMAITGDIFLMTADPENVKAVIYHSNLALPSAMQILTFIAGITFLIVFGARTLRGLKEQAGQIIPAPKRKKPRSLRRI